MHKEYKKNPEKTVTYAKDMFIYAISCVNAGPAKKSDEAGVSLVSKNDVDGPDIEGTSNNERN